MQENKEFYVVIKGQKAFVSEEVYVSRKNGCFLLVNSSPFAV